MELISIVVPIYNVQSYLERCITSIIEQTYKNIEIILVDDGATDESPNICDYFANIDKRIKVIHKANGGLSDARNAGISIAKGEMIAFVDSDDWISPYYVEILHQEMQSRDVDIVECEIVKTEGVHSWKKPDECLKSSCYNVEDALKLLILDNVFHQYVWNKLYRRTLIDGIVFPVGKCNEDEFWTYQVFGKAKKISKVEVPLYCYFQRPGSIMGQTYNKRRLDAIEGKIERQDYIVKYFPKLVPIAKINLVESVIYAGQMSLKYLTGQDKKQAITYLKKVYSSLSLEYQERQIMNLSRCLWCFLSKISFLGTCMLKNLLKKGF